MAVLQSSSTRALLPAAGDAPPREGLARLAWWLLLATIALLPFEFWLPQFPFGRLTVTTLEGVWGVALVAWFAMLVAERRLPRFQRPIAVGIAALLGLGLASAAAADGHNLDAF